MIIGAYWGPLLVTFVIVLFLFSMQWIWKWVDDLMGKGLPWDVLAKLIAYATSAFVPAVLPLAVLLSSIMTLGGLGERSELIPMRSAGLGLFRILAPLIICMIGLAGFSFYFSNNVLPIANLKFQSLLWDVTQTKPALNLRPGIFSNDLTGFSIRVADKDDQTGKLTDVLIYDHRKPFQANRTVMRAKHGTMRRSTDGQTLILELYDGHFYDEQGEHPAGPAHGTLPLFRGAFQREDIHINLSEMGMKRTDEELFKDHYKMLTLGQLDAAQDSLTARMDLRRAEMERHLRSTLAVMRDRPDEGRAPLRLRAQADTADRQMLAMPYPIAMDKARRAINNLERMIAERDDRTTQIAKFKIEWHRKLMLAFACVVFFFIGAPLGAIVRKGGMGLPAVIAILFFLLFHILSYSTEQMVKAGTLQAWPGMWISTLVLLPIGFFLTWKAATDSPLFDPETYTKAWKRIAKLTPPYHARPTTVQ